MNFGEFAKGARVAAAAAGLSLALLAMPQSALAAADGMTAPVALETEGKAPVAVETEGKFAVAVETEGKSPFAVETEGKFAVAVETEGKSPFAVETEGKSPLAMTTEGKVPVAITTEGKMPMPRADDAPKSQLPVAIETEGKTAPALAEDADTPLKGIAIVALLVILAVFLRRPAATVRSRRAFAGSMAALAGGIALTFAMVPQPTLAAAPAAAAPEVAAPAAAAPEAAASANDNAAAAAAAPVAPAYPRMKPTEGKGMPIQGAIGLQDQYSPLGDYGHWIHNAVLMPIITVITLFVLGLLLWVIARYNRRANPVASKTSHNSTIEVIWTLVPVLILVGIAVPSIDLLAKQFKPAPAKALTVKVTGNQWFWTYTYPDNGGVELTSYMLNEPGQPLINNGVREVGSDPSDGPGQLEVDNRLVLPVGEKIRLQITAADVIHSFAVPSLWFKLDAVPGRINEKVLEIREPGVYYGQCSELCGVKHGYMPIAIEALPRAEFNKWVLAQAGGTIEGQGGDGQDKPADAAATASEAPAAAAPAAPAAE